MAQKTQEELMTELASRIRSGGSGGLTTAQDVRLLITDIVDTLFALTDASGISSKADDNKVVHKVGGLDETVDGIKRFADARFAAMYLTVATLIGSPVDGKVEYNGADLYFTIGTTRTKVLTQATADQLYAMISHTHTASEITDFNSAFAALFGSSIASVNTAISNKADKTLTINGHALTSSFSLAKADLGLSNVDNTSDASKPVSTAQQTALNLKVDKVAGKQLSTEDYTTTEKGKLASLSQYYQGTYATLVALQTAIPTGQPGWYAIVDASGSDAVQYIWDDTDSDWVSGGAGSGSVSSVNSQTGVVTLTTDDIPEGATNKYFTAARVIVSVLTGIGFGTATAVVAADTILQAIGKLQAQITALFKIPTGGTTGQVLAKSSNADGAVTWVTPSGGGSSEPSGQIKSFRVDYGAVGDGVTNDLSAINTAIAANDVLEDFGDFYISGGSISNKYGKKIQGNLRFLQTSPLGTGYMQQLNSYADNGQHVFGAEYLSSFHKKLKANMTASSPTNLNIVFSGDSTTAGTDDGSDTAIDQLFTVMMAKDYIPAVTTINHGRGGQATSAWLSTYLADDLSVAPDVLVLRWGINDMSNSVTPQGLVDMMDTGLNTIRSNASYTKDKLAIVLCTMNTTTDDSIGHKGEIFCEEYNKGLRTLARKYACCYIDIYALWQDARQGQDYFNPYDPINHPNEFIHPSRSLKILIACKTYEVLFPIYYRGRDIVDLGQSGRLFTALPAAYRLGITYEYVEIANGWPINGFLITHHLSNAMYRQELASFGSTDNKFYIRVGWGPSGWQPFYITEPLPTQIAYNLNTNGRLFSAPYTAYPNFAMTMEYVNDSDGWPVAGTLFTLRIDGIFTQTLTNLGTPVRQFVRGGFLGTGTFSEVAKLDSSGAFAAAQPIKLKGYTVSTLPAGSAGMEAYVTDATSPTTLATVTGGGSSTVKVFYNGTNWIVQ